ncbi:hypothetical protein ARHIZOSPH14_28030 [Agromyces rhizosphaerae]|uniref:DUF6458 domain-containing protein n=1 Tax=Agromyces rhizosphaerae TaxID=88374 RepID=A0A9W6FQH0_9MICO|nr:DUF6458 family protein [Agromyces rhizosphaerae]GLI28561.1 hypothetical protein ARHIZOSPH14_28030 [Agromyces rhizosphaerae]
MSIGLGIVLFAIGAILAFALNVAVDWINLGMVGIILMVAGAVVVIIGIIMLARRRTASSTSSTTVDENGNKVTRTEHTAPGPDEV